MPRKTKNTTRNIEVPEAHTGKTLATAKVKELAEFVRKYDLLNGSTKREDVSVCMSWNQWFALVFPDVPASKRKHAHRTAALLKAGDPPTVKAHNRKAAKGKKGAVTTNAGTVIEAGATITLEITDED